MSENIPATDSTRARGNGYELFMLALCVLALLALAADRLFRLSPDIRRLIEYADFAICVLFFVDFVHSLATAKKRLRYFFTWGWIDLLSSVPSVDILRLGRAARILRVFRVLRGAKATRVLTTHVLDRRAEGAFTAVTLATLLLLLFASVAVLHFEAVPGANIKGPEDAIWWAFTTLTTVGYGDRYPVTSEGRAVAVVLMLVGVCLVGVFAGLFTSWFMAPAATQNRSEIEQLRTEISLLRRAIESRDEHE